MTTATYTSQSPSSPRSILSRITSPFKPKARHISDFHIQTEEPYRQYSPGDVVKGSVFLTVHKPVRITHIVLSLHGFVKVYKNATTNAHAEAASRDGGYLGSGRGNRGVEFFGNGLASIFEDEVVLCGEGRLTVNVYAFKFELQFPSSRLPSSIDFERGSITYMLTATLTRPTTISPTLNCERNVYLTESVDIASILSPKPRVITLEPIPRRSKQRSQPKASLSESKDISTKPKDPVAQPERPSSPESTIRRRSLDPPLSPAPSAVSSASLVSSSNTSSQVGPGHPKPNKGYDKGFDGHSSIESRPDGTITATVELLRGGCLPGDFIPVKISIEHTKVVKRLQGIIITLYRLGRVDRQPLVPLGPSTKGKKVDHEDYYPRSRTGLGGLSLSSADSGHAFRMDLAQNFAPLIVDPNSLTAVIKTSIQVPDDVFPTISCTPGAMITFKYFVEVVMDIRGKLANQDRFLPRMTMTGAPSPYGNPNASNRLMGNMQRNPTHGLPVVVDADQIRRDKSVISCLFEVIVGTKDSQRKTIKQKIDQEDAGTSEAFDTADPGFDSFYEAHEDYHAEDPLRERAGQYEGSQDNYMDQNMVDHPNAEGPVLFIPPQLPEVTDEKARIRMAEQRLLPSSPPIDDEYMSMSSSAAPSAPMLSDLHGHGEFLSDEPSAPAYANPSSPSSEAIAPGSVEYTHTRDGQQHGTQANAHVQDDKQEMERQRLLAAASAPPDDTDDDNETEPSRPAVTTPTAPVFNEEDECQTSPPQYITYGP